MSFFSMLYDKIPEDHVLKRIWNVVDFDFINELLQEFRKTRKRACFNDETLFFRVSV